MIKNSQDNVLALAQHLLGEEWMNYSLDKLDDTLSDHEIETINDYIDTAEQAIEDYDYDVFHENDIDEAFRERVENLFDDVWLEIMKQHWNYDVTVDDDWDVEVTYSMTISDRGTEMSGYDWVEHQEEVNGNTFYIYRQN